MNDNILCQYIDKGEMKRIFFTPKYDIKISRGSILDLTPDGIDKLCDAIDLFLKNKDKLSLQKYMHINYVNKSWEDMILEISKILSSICYFVRNNNIDINIGKLELIMAYLYFIIIPGGKNE